MKIYYNLHNIVSIKVDTENPEIIEECDYLLRVFRVAEEPKEADMEIMDFDKFSLPQHWFLDVQDFVYGFKNGIYSQKESYAITFEDKKITLYLEKPKLVLTPFLEYILLQNNCTIIHGAGISYKDKGIIFPAFGNAGKTLLVSKLREKENVKFFGDDYLILSDQGDMYSYPIDFSIFNHHFKFYPELKEAPEAKINKQIQLRKRLMGITKHLPMRKALKEIAKFIGHNPPKRNFIKVPAERLIPKEKFGSKVNLSYGIFLSRYSGNELKIEDLKLEDAVKEVFGILQQECYPTMSVYYLLSSFGIFNFVEYFEGIENVIRKSFQGLKFYRAFIPTNISGAEYTAKMEDFLERIT